MNINDKINELRKEGYEVGRLKVSKEYELVLGKKYIGKVPWRDRDNSHQAHFILISEETGKEKRCGLYITQEALIKDDLEEKLRRKGLEIGECLLKIGPRILRDELQENPDLNKLKNEYVISSNSPYLAEFFFFKRGSDGGVTTDLEEFYKGTEESLE